MVSFLFEKGEKPMNIYPKISNKVGKLGESIGTINLPPFITCRADAPCMTDCYACRGNFNFESVKESHRKNLAAYVENPQKFFEILDHQLQMIPYKFFRYHSSGDIIDTRYLEGMCWLARRHKGTQFLCFTKKYEIVNEYLKLHRKPVNLILVLSNWGEWICENPHNLPTAWVHFKKKDNSNIPIDAIECSGNCGTCCNTESSCWALKKGQSVFFHKH